MRRALRALLLPLLLCASCSPVRATPREAFEAVRAAVAAGDGAALFAAHDSDTREHRRQRLREWRALLARGDPPEEVLAGSGIGVDEVTSGTVEEAAVRIFAAHSPMVRDAEWFASADVVEEQREGEDTAQLLLRGADGAQRSLWFLREGGTWCLDYYRTSMPR